MKLVSIISVTYNAVNKIEHMINSVIKQNGFSDIEFIIIDGKSNDGTVDIIKKYDDYISYWISEPDDGIYDAMNKGLEVATGKYVYFLGSDDTLYDNNVFRNIKNTLLEDADIVCGNLYLVDDKLKMQKLKKSNPEKKMIMKGMMIPHQSMFMKTDIARRYGFSVDYKLAADYDLLLRVVLDNHNIKILYVDSIIANYSVLGKSSTETNEVVKEYMGILKKYISEDIANSFYKKNNNTIKKYIKTFVKYFISEKYIRYFRGWYTYK